MTISNCFSCLHCHSLLMIYYPFIVHSLRLCSHWLHSTELSLDHGHALSSPFRIGSGHLSLVELHPYFVHSQLMMQTLSFFKCTSSNLRESNASVTTTDHSWQSIISCPLIMHCILPCFKYHALLRAEEILPLLLHYPFQLLASSHCKVIQIHL